MTFSFVVYIKVLDVRFEPKFFVVELDYFIELQNF